MRPLDCDAPHFQSLWSKWKCGWILCPTLKCKTQMTPLPTRRITVTNEDINIHWSSRVNTSRNKTNPISSFSSKDNEACRVLCARFCVYWNLAVVFLCIKCICQDGLSEARNSTCCETWGAALSARLVQHVSVLKDSETTSTVCELFSS